MSERLTIEKNEEGVYLSVEEGVSLAEVLDFLTRERISNFESDAVEKALETPGKKTRIAQGEARKDAKIKVEISRDSMIAKISVEPPEGDAPWPKVSDLKNALETKNIIYGIDESALQSIIDGHISDQWVDVAQGNAAIDGRNAEVEYVVEFGSSRPLGTNEGGKVDLKELSSVTIVHKDQVLATRVPQTDGQNGINVFGKTVKAKNGKDRKLPAGHGTRPSEDGTTLYADQDGHLVFRGSVLDVLPIYVVPGDVDYSVGNVHFIGSVDVKGAVRDGFEIKTSGNVSIGGVVEGAVIENDGDLEIKIGVSGGNKGHIRSGGSLTAGYIDKATIHVDENLQVKDAIMHSNVSAGKSVIAGSRGGKGQIVGGKVQAGISVSCVTLGSQMGTKTEVHVGVSPDLANRKNELGSLIEENKEKLNQIDTNIAFLKKIEKAGKLDTEKRTVMLKLTKGSFQLRSLIDGWTKELEEVELKIERSRSDPKVNVKETCYPGVSITMRGITYLVREEMRFITFRYDGGELKPLPYDP